MKYSLTKLNVICVFMLLRAYVFVYVTVWIIVLSRLRSTTTEIHSFYFVNCVCLRLWTLVDMCITRGSFKHCSIKQTLTMRTLLYGSNFLRQRWNIMKNILKIGLIVWMLIKFGIVYFAKFGLALFFIRTHLISCFRIVFVCVQTLVVRSKATWSNTTVGPN